MALADTDVADLQELGLDTNAGRTLAARVKGRAFKAGMDKAADIARKTKAKKARLRDSWQAGLKGHAERLRSATQTDDRNESLYDAVKVLSEYLSRGGKLETENERRAVMRTVLNAVFSEHGKLFSALAGRGMALKAIECYEHEYRASEEIEKHIEQKRDLRPDATMDLRVEMNHVLVIVPRKGKFEMIGAEFPQNRISQITHLSTEELAAKVGDTVDNLEEFLFGTAA